MPNSELFQNRTTNNAGGAAFALSAKHALAQYAATGCFNSTYYVGAKDQLAKVLELRKQVDDEFAAKCAVYARKNGFMKDVPAFLCATLPSPIMAKVFDTVIDDGKMLRNFVQFIRSGTTGRKSLGTRPRRLVQKWLASKSESYLFNASVGNDPSLADVIRLAHPKPATKSRTALYAYILGKEYVEADLPDIVKKFEAFKANGADAPNVPFQMIAPLNLSQNAWLSVARTATWHTTRMNLNTFMRHGVFPALTDVVATRLRAEVPEKLFPYQLMAAYKASVGNVPVEITNALQDAMEKAVENTPSITGKVYILVDVSGSMSSPVTGDRGMGATTTVSCLDVASLIAASVLRKNPNAEVIPFDTDVRPITLNPRDSVMTNAALLAQYRGGGTECASALRHLNGRMANGDVVIMVSDNESWSGRDYGLDAHWNTFVSRNKQAKLVCIDLSPGMTTQVKDRRNVLNVGGFSDNVFSILSTFTSGDVGSEHWISQIDKIVI